MLNVFFHFIITISSTPISSTFLHCYDSTGPLAMNIVECESANQVCYQEYFDVTIPEDSNQQQQYFDRFCAPELACSSRGIPINGTCVNLRQLPYEIQQVFLSKRLKDERINSTHLRHTRFCCCNMDHCNNFDSGNAYAEFGVNPIITGKKMSSSSTLLDHAEAILILSCFLFSFTCTAMHTLPLCTIFCLGNVIAF